MKVVALIIITSLSSILNTPAPVQAEYTWQPVVNISGTDQSNSVEDDWIIDGGDPDGDGDRNTVITYTPQGLLQDTSAGTTQDYSSILWTKADFIGPVKLEFDYTLLQSINAPPAGVAGTIVNIILFAGHGLGTTASPTDISTWERPVSDTFNRNLNHHTISYATTNNEFRSRINVGNRLVEPTKTNVNFQKNTLYHITAIFDPDQKILSITAQQPDTQNSYQHQWALPTAHQQGRVGLRQMYGRQSLYSNIVISQPGTPAPTPTNTQAPIPTDTIAPIPPTEALTPTETQPPIPDNTEAPEATATPTDAPVYADNLRLYLVDYSIQPATEPVNFIRMISEHLRTWLPEG